MTVKAGEDLWLDLWIVGTDTGQTQHGLGLEPMGCAPAGSGDRTGIARGDAFPNRGFGDAWINALAVWTTTAPAGAVATIGDSLTDGYCAPRFRHARWPDVLAARGHGAVGVANAGIDGDTIVSPAGLAFGPTALDRWQRDVASLPAVRTVVIFEGTNDLIYGSTAGQVDDGLRQLVSLAHAAGMQAIGATLIPRANPAESPSFELERVQVNQAIRDGSIGFDRVIDFDHVVGLANDSDIQSQFDCGDHVHLDQLGYQALGNAIPLPRAR
jgi:lysophospholipase L1-like esterase